jgi:DNA polymerase-3 subunit gamma/tau
MENFVVSARKYRPSNFNSVVGQLSITTTLKNAIQRKHLAQAYLFCGPRGVGKTTCARIFAKTINCLNLSPQIEACNECESCVSFNSSRSFNIHELDAASNNSVEGIRKLIEQVRIPPQISKYSVYIIDEVHMLSQSAFNAFLKTLEEPPAHAIFILATTEKHKILPTILSRCQIYDFNRIKVEDTVTYLEHIAKAEGVKYEAEALNVIAQKADGAMRDALSIFDQVVSFSDNNITYANVIENLNVLDYQYYFKLTDNFIKGEFSDTLRIFDELLSKGFDSQQFVSGLSTHIRNLLVCKDNQTLSLLEVGAAIAERYKNMSATCPPDFLIGALDLTNQCDVTFRQSTNQRLHVELMLIKLCGLNQEKKKDSSSELAEITLEPEAKKNSRSGVVELIPEPQVKNDAPKPVDLSVNEPIVKPQVRNSAPKSFSIKVVNGTPPVKPLESVEVETELSIDDAGTFPDLDEAIPDINEDNLKENWLLFANRVKESNPNHSSILQAHLPELVNELQIGIVLTSQLHVDLFLEIKPDLLLFLRNQYKSKMITIAETIEELQIQNSKPYTTEDKFKFMLQKNPTLVKLKQDLNLDFV